MGQNVLFTTPLHQRAKRNYIERVTSDDKAASAAIARQFGQEYWDGDRRYGYGGYHYDGRWAPVAAQLIEHYQLKENARLLDVGCGKGFLLYELTKLLPKAEVRGVDISKYALAHAKEEIRPQLVWGSAEALPFEDGQFDLVISLMTLHNLRLPSLAKSLSEMQRVTRKDAFLSVESYRSEAEKVNLLYWQLTCESFFTPEEWTWLFEKCGYRGDYEFLFFE